MQLTQKSQITKYQRNKKKKNRKSIKQVVKWQTKIQACENFIECK